MAYYDINLFRNIDAPEPSFRSGFASVFVPKTRGRYSRFLSNGDRLLYKVSWEAVGDAMRVAMDKYAKEYGRR